MGQPQGQGGKDPKEQPAEESAPLPEGEGESAGRRRGLEKGGGRPLTEQLEDGQRRGQREDGLPSTGTHGGPKRDSSAEPTRE
jgi:hypothetical protein